MGFGHKQVSSDSDEKAVASDFRSALSSLQAAGKVFGAALLGSGLENFLSLCQCLIGNGR